MDITLGSPAADTVLQRGDIIIEVEKKPVSTVEEFNDALRNATNSLLLLVFRNNSTFYVSINLLAFADEAKKYREMSVKPFPFPRLYESLLFRLRWPLIKDNMRLLQLYIRMLCGLLLGGLKATSIVQSSCRIFRRFKEAVAQMKKYLLLAPDAKDARTAQDNMYKWEAME